GRRVWSIDLETVWLPFFLATNTMGETRVPSEAIGAPLRLAYNPDGTVKFSKSGRPITKVAKELGDSIRLVRENFTASLRSYANGVIAENTEGYRAQVEAARQAGAPIMARDKASLDKALADMIAESMREAEGKVETVVKAEGEAGQPAVTNAEAEAKAEAVREAEAIAKGKSRAKREKVAVPA
ncbi:MAG: hypothetical protein HY670_10505, partial [Chloroflexi bacterium]|nr:hypothetical protein [Chloroflexota bacterium]